VAAKMEGTKSFMVASDRLDCWGVDLVGAVKLLLWIV
jgi:hypothetical protein